MNKKYLTLEEAAKYLKTPLSRLREDYLAGLVKVQPGDSIRFMAENLDEYAWAVRRFFSLEDAAKYTGVPVGTIRDHQYSEVRKQLDGRVLSNTLIFTRQQLDAYLKGEMLPFPDNTAFTTEQAVIYLERNGYAISAQSMGQCIHVKGMLHSEKVGAIRVMHKNDLDQFARSRRPRGRQRRITNDPTMETRQPRPSGN